MKVLHITNAFPCASHPALGIFVEEQIASLEEIGVQTDVVFINAIEYGKKEYLRYIFKIRELSKNYDLIHCHHTYCGIIFMLSKVNKPWMISLLGDITKERYIDRLFFKIIKRNAERIILKNTKILADERFVYLPNGVNLDFFSPEKKNIAREKLCLDANQKFVLFVSAGQISRKEKRHDKFIAVLNELQQKGHVLQPLYLEKVKRDQVPLYYNACDLLLLTSDHEGSPNAVKEALACNKPVVSTDVGNVKTLLQGCPGCFVARENSVAELTQLVLKAMNVTYSGGRERLIEQQLDHISVAKKLKGLYKEILKERN